MAKVITFPSTGRTIRAINIVPDRSDGDACRSMLVGLPLHSGEDLAFRGPLWRVKMMVKDYRRGLPVYVHPDCEGRVVV